MFCSFEDKVNYIFYEILNVYYGGIKGCNNCVLTQCL